MADPAVQAIGSSSAAASGARVQPRVDVHHLKPLGERGGLTTQQVIDRLRKNLCSVPGISLFMFAAQDIRAGGRQSDSELPVHALQHRS